MQELILICGTITICTLIISHTILRIKAAKTIDVIIDGKSISEKIKEINEREENEND